MIPDAMKVAERMLDIHNPDRVEVVYHAKRGVMYVHVNGITALRICGITRMPLFEFDINFSEIITSPERPWK